MSQALSSSGSGGGFAANCVLGSNVAASLFPVSSPLDQTILIDKFNYVVVGVIEERRLRRLLES